MSHFFTIVMIPEATQSDEIEETCACLLAPYDENRCVAPYKVYLDTAELEMMAKHYQLTPQDLTALARHMEDWTGCPGRVDEQGLYRMSTFNPQAKWDWWTIGGRWHGAVQGTRNNDDHGGELFRHLSENTLLARHLDHKLSCFALVTPDGQWHEQGEMGWFALVANEKDDHEWDEEVTTLIQQYRDVLLVGIDCHI